MKFGIAGAGTIGLLRARSVAEHAGLTLAAVMDPDQARARAGAAPFPGARATGTLDELFATEGLEAVIVSSPVQFHEEACIQALESGLHVLCEKPLSNSLDSCRRIYEAARASGRTLATGFNHRYYPAIKYVKAAIEGGLVGRLDHLRVFGGHDGLHNFRADWQYKGPLSGGGAMMDVGIHMTDLARYLAGEVTEVYGWAGNRVWQVEGSEDNAVAVFRTETGVPIFYQATWTEWRGYRFYVDAYGDQGMVRGYYAPMSNLLVTRTGPGARRTKRKIYPEIMVREKLKSWTSTALLSFKDELHDFLRMIRGEKHMALADGWSGVRAIEIATAVYESTASGQAVRLTPRR
jgi:predicted dehydrogenase